MRPPPANPSPARRREAGFGLVETLVALAILAVTAASFYSAAVASVRSVSGLDDRREAVLVARSVLDSARTTAAASAILPEGRSGHLAWRLSTQPFREATGDAPALELLTVEVSRTDDRTRLLRLTTIRARR